MIKGGSDKIAIALIHTINRYGGEVLTRKKVTKIVCDDTHAVGVEVNGDTLMPCDIIISERPSDTNTGTLGYETYPSCFQKTHQ